MEKSYEKGLRDGIEMAAKEIREGYDRPGIYTKTDVCLHSKFKWEDCDECSALAILNLLEPRPSPL